EVAGDLVVEIDLIAVGNARAAARGRIRRYCADHGITSYADVEAAALAVQAAVVSGGFDQGYIVGGGKEHARAARRAVVLGNLVLRAGALVAQGELQAVAAGLEAGVLQGALELRRVAAQHVEGGGPLDHQVRRDVAVLIDVEPHVDATELGRIEPD